MEFLYPFLFVLGIVIFTGLVIFLTNFIKRKTEINQVNIDTGLDISLLLLDFIMMKLQNIEDEERYQKLARVTSYGLAYIQEVSHQKQGEELISSAMLMVKDFSIEFDIDLNDTDMLIIKKLLTLCDQIYRSWNDGNNELSI